MVMSLVTPVICGFLWIIVANLLGMIPSRDGHRARAAFLIVTGIPLLAWLFWENGPLAAIIFLAGALSVLRVPALVVLRRIMRAMPGQPARAAD
jgi:hypothetical protein